MVERLPKTRSGKILRGVMGRIADGQRRGRSPATIDDPAVLDEIGASLARIGLSTLAAMSVGYKNVFANCDGHGVGFSNCEHDHSHFEN